MTLQVASSSHLFQNKPASSRPKLRPAAGKVCVTATKVLVLERAHAETIPMKEV